MRDLRWQVLFGLFLIGLSAFIYYLHYRIFSDMEHILIFSVEDLAFLPIEVLVVTLILDSIFRWRDKQNRLEKLNMVIGAFFSEVGTKLLTYFSGMDSDLDEIRLKLIVKSEWSNQEFMEVSKWFKSYDYDIVIKITELEYIRTTLQMHRDFMLRLIENPLLLEHESFTTLMFAVFHLSEELAIRSNLAGLPESDLLHLSDDVKRAYMILVSEWLDYLNYLRRNYPYLFSLAMRTNPFDKTASPIVR
jgi:hypothetical protein